MLTPLLAHQGEPLAPHDLWTHWNSDPLVGGGLLLLVVAYMRGVRLHPRTASRRRAWCFAAATASLVVAIVSPLDALAGELASAHMVQHVLLVVIVAPLLALSSPLAALLAGLPRNVRKSIGRARGRTAALRRRVTTHEPAASWLVQVGALWFWHASLPYDAALDNNAIHIVEHTILLASALWFWSTVIHPRRIAGWSYGHSALLVFATALQGVFLAALLTFATSPWYGSYLDSAPRWGLEPLADQQLAGAIMWVPAGLGYAAAGVVLIALWLRQTQLCDRTLPSDWGSEAAEEGHADWGERHRQDQRGKRAALETGQEQVHDRRAGALAGPASGDGPPQQGAAAEQPSVRPAS